jgi:hypothetical protein
MSLAENVVREAMHQADEFEAFTRPVADGATAAEIAVRFGVSERQVLGRLAMAKLDKKILKAFRAGEIKLEHVMAFTISDDKKKQLEVLEAFEPDYDDANDIRVRLTDQLIGPDESIAKFVGADAYQKAGGRARSDLFGDEIFYEDAALLHKLAKEKLNNVEKSLLGDGWGWVEIVTEGNQYEATKHMTRIWIEPTKKTEKALLGCVVSIGYSGKPDVNKCYLKKEDAKAFMELKPKAADQQTIKQGKEPGAMPESLSRALQSYRLEVAQLAIAQNPSLAYDLFLFHAATAVCDLHAPYDGPNISFNRTYPFPSIESSTPAAKALNHLEAKLSLAWMNEEDEVRKFEAFQRLTTEQKSAFVTYCTAVTIRPKFAPTPDQQHTAYDSALEQSGVQVDKLWRPTADNYLSKIKTDQLLELGTYLFNPAWAEKRKSEKKSVLVKELDQAFADPSKHPGSEERLRTWLPERMSFLSMPQKATKTKKKAA